MSKLYPLLMKPYFDPRPWGARDLAPIYDKHVHPGEQPIGEAWLTWDKCKIANGPLAGILLGDACNRFGTDLVGAACETNRFPLLIKFLFPREKLSVQVHPDDETAQKQGEPCGKTECWYVVEAEPGAQVGLGLKPGSSRAEFEKSIRENRAEELLNWVDLQRGDLVYVDAGTVHTLGPGSIILETQQNSDTTYRLYDYGRPRELHLEQGLEAMKERTAAGKTAPIRLAGNQEQLISVSHFQVHRFRLSRSAEQFVSDGTSPKVAIALNGCGVIEHEQVQAVAFARGDAVIIPASVRQFSIRPQWDLEFLMASVPHENEKGCG